MLAPRASPWLREVEVGRGHLQRLPTDAAQVSSKAWPASLRTSLRVHGAFSGFIPQEQVHLASRLGETRAHGAGQGPCGGKRELVVKHPRVPGPLCRGQAVRWGPSR